MVKDFIRLSSNLAFLHFVCIKTKVVENVKNKIRRNLEPNTKDNFTNTVCLSLREKYSQMFLVTSRKENFMTLVEKYNGPIGSSLCTTINAIDSANGIQEKCLLNVSWSDWLHRDPFFRILAQSKFFEIFSV